MGSSEDVSEEAALAPARLRPRFVDPETERAYLSWQLEQSASFNRVALGAAMVAWLGLGLLYMAFGGAGHGLGAITLFAGLLVIATFGLATTRPGRIRWMPVAIAIWNGATGLGCLYVVALTVFPSVNPIERTGWICTVGAICGAYGFAVLRMRPRHAAPAVGAYLLASALWVLKWYVDGKIDAFHLGASTFALTTIMATGFVLNVVIDVSLRHAFAQRRVIERQRETIAKQQELLKRELSHQVAERSRELGAAFAHKEPSIAPPPLAPGDRFHSRYKLVRPLGEGGMGAVYEVERTTDGQKLALKIVTGVVSPVAAARFAREAEIGARVHHENLVAIVDVGIAEGGAPFLVMELVRGGSLEAKREKFGDTAFARTILLQIAKGLAELHAAGVVHRDLKPGNVLLHGEPPRVVAKISDFGISRLDEADAGIINPEAHTLDAASPKSPNLTGTGAMLGTPLYMAPEAASGGKVAGAAADVFAFGLIAHELLTKKMAFDMPPVLLALAKQPLPAPPAIDAKDVPDRAKLAIASCLLEDPNARPSARALVEALSD